MFMICMLENWNRNTGSYGPHFLPYAMFVMSNCWDQSPSLFFCRSLSLPFSLGMFGNLETLTGNCVDLPCTFTTNFVSRCIKPSLQRTCTSSGTVWGENYIHEIAWSFLCQIHCISLSSN
jgi:hypothetical protein